MELADSCTKPDVPAYITSFSNLIGKFASIHQPGCQVDRGVLFDSSENVCSLRTHSVHGV
eukprot:1156119-Pelagomonas_calceolata.AAC.19